LNKMPDSDRGGRPPLSAAQKWARFGLIGAVALIVITLFAYVGGHLSRSRLTQSRMIAAFQEASGTHPGFRRNHAKGVCVAGWFDSSGQAAAWSKAAVFESDRRVPLVGRFALAGGMPFQNDSPHTVRSMALRLKPANGAEWRTGMNNIPVFVVNSAEGFYEQLVASKPDPATGKPDPTAMKEFLSRHPETVRAVAIIKAHRASDGFADSTYNSLDAFRLVNAAGASVPVRWAAVPLQEAVIQANSPDDDSAPPAPGNRLFDDLIAQIHEHPLQWRLVITLGQSGDSTADATSAWPDDRRHIDAGRVTIDQVSSEDDGACADINFDPLVLPPGIEPSDDPLLSARSAVYARSFMLRAAEKPAKAPSAVSAREAAGVVKP
jgi:catalase